jgi:hypothetical protein
MEDEAFVGPLLKKPDSAKAIPRAKGMGSSVGRAKALPQAKPLEVESPSSSSGSGINLDASLSGPSPIIKIGEAGSSSVRHRRPAKGDPMVYVWLGLGAAATVLLLIVIYAMFNGGASNQPTPHKRVERESTAWVQPALVTPFPQALTVGRSPSRLPA